MKKLSLILLVLLAFGPMAWAQTGSMYPAGSESQLNAAIGYCTTADDYINVTDNITLTSHITIPAGKTITINLGGHTLRRNLSSGTDMGCVIIVAATGNLTISNGTLSGGWNSYNDGTNTAGCLVNKGTAAINNVTISGCKGNDGGGIMNAENATLNITEGSITNCQSTAHGGGAIVNYGTATVSNCTMSGNTAYSRGGAIYNNGSLTVSGCTITGNTATNNDGGALHLETGTADLSNVIITNNSSKDAGGIYVKADATLTMTGTNTISDNTSSEHGGGGLVNYGTTTLSGCTFSGNTAKTSGGAIWNKSSLTVSDCTFDDNEALATGGDEHNEGNGGAIHLEGGTATLTDVNITNNTSKDAGGIFVKSGATLNLGGTTGSTLSGNTSSQHGGGGIVNEGTVNLSGSVSITGNTSHTYGGGIWNNSTLNLQGTIVVTGNTTDNNGTQNLYINQDKVISFTGALASGSSIGLSRTVGYYNFAYTSGFSTNNPQFSNGAPVACFTDDIDPTNYQFVASDELFHCPVNYGDDVEDADYINDNGVALTRPACIKINSITDNASATLYPGWYVVDTDKTFNNRITVEGVVNLILKDGTTLTPNLGIFIPKGSTFHVWAQSESNVTGRLYVTNDNMPDDEDMAGIGGNYETRGGSVHIHGGKVMAQGKGWGAGIGGGGGSGRGTFDNITISGGFVTAYGDVDPYGGSSLGGAGIGGGVKNIVPDITITGGTVLALGGANAAGIGSGAGGFNHVPDSEHQYYRPGPLCPYKTIRITGGEVVAFGNGNGAGIGGGSIPSGYYEVFPWYGLSGNIFIEGGHVSAVTMDAYQVYTSTGVAQSAQAIGHGHMFNETEIAAGASSLYPGAKVNGTEEPNSQDLYTLGKNDRLNAIVEIYHCFKKVEIAPCDHPAATTYTDNNNGTYTTDCAYCTGTNLPHICTHDGNWNDGASWQSGHVPNGGQDVILWASATIPSGYTANAANVTLNGSGDGTLTLTIADGGQLLHTNEGVVATVEKNITAYTVSQNQGELLTDGWYFIASPVTDNYTPAGSMIANTYDLYRLNPTSGKWENFKNTTEHADFTALNNGAGYLYANSEQTNLGFTGELKPYSEADGNNQVSVTAGWNLVGNPFVCNVYASQPFYKMNEARTGLSAELPASTVIAPCEGIIIDAAAAGIVAFTKPSQASSAPSNGSLQIALSEAVERGTAGHEALMDNAIVSFNEGSQLGKFYFGEQSANIYLPQGGEEYAIAYSDKQGEMPLNFKATKNGTYTITVNPENVEMAYLHLIDNFTGADVDLLQTPNYSFNANVTDYESRFKLVFVANGEDGPSTGSGTFAFYSNGNWNISNVGEATLQVIDVNGRILSSETVNGSVSKAIHTAPGIYMLRLINGENVKVQKIVIR